MNDDNRVRVRLGRRSGEIALGAVFLMVSGLLASAGCVSVRAPERIEVSRHESKPVDPGRIPATSSHEESRRYLIEAYQRIQELESDNARLSRKADEYKAERDRCREQTRSDHDD